jgi:hypothetical protein
MIFYVCFDRAVGCIFGELLNNSPLFPVSTDTFGDKLMYTYKVYILYAVFVIHVYTQQILAYKTIFWELNFGPKVYVRLIGMI